MHEEIVYVFYARAFNILVTAVFKALSQQVGWNKF
jgi:hypothetical protein